MGLLGIVDVETILPLQADLESDLPNLIQGFPGEQPHGHKKIEDSIYHQLSLMMAHAQLHRVTFELRELIVFLA
jgi:hypothetical protein